MKRFVITPRAKQDINEIWDYIADDSIEAADRVMDALDGAIVRLAMNPGIGHWRIELADKTTSVLAGPFVPHRLP